MAAPMGMERPKVKTAGTTPQAAPRAAPASRPVAPPPAPYLTAPPTAETAEDKLRGVWAPSPATTISSTCTSSTKPTRRRCAAPSDLAREQVLGGPRSHSTVSSACRSLDSRPLGEDETGLGSPATGGPAAFWQAAVRSSSLLQLQACSGVETWDTRGTPLRGVVGGLLLSGAAASFAGQGSWGEPAPVGEPTAAAGPSWSQLAGPAAARVGATEASCLLKAWTSLS
mmetsp:Transcript_24288/g.55425  ORF Transcript_24288/g.55425 Transcript_24288/m.55425 type:complete len:227 (+) Transcript_24288:293-973(+)